MVYGSTSQLDLSSVGQLIIDVSGQNDTLGPSAAPEDLDENAQGRQPSTDYDCTPLMPVFRFS